LELEVPEFGVHDLSGHHHVKLLIQVLVDTQYITATTTKKTKKQLQQKNEEWIYIFKTAFLLKMPSACSF